MVGLLVDRPAVGLGEDQVLVVPLGAGQHLLAELRGLVPVQLADERHRQGERALAAAGLGLLVDQPAAADPVDAPPDRQRAREQVDVFPLQRQGLGLPQAEGEGDGPASGVADVRRGFEDGAGLAEVEGGGDVAGALGGRVDEGGDVAGDVSALDRNRERPGQDPVVAQHGGGGVAGVEERGVELVEMLGAQPVHSVAADAGDQVPADGGLIALQRSLSHPAWRDGGQPVLEPPGNGRGRRLADRPGVALALEVSDLCDHDAAVLAADVPAVELSVERETDGDVAVPAPVGALVDRRLAVRGASRHWSPLGRGLECQSGRAIETGGAVVDSRGIGRRRAEFEEFTLVRGGPGPAQRAGGFQAANVAFELAAGEAAAPADVDGAQVASLHQRVDRRAPEAEHRGGLLGCEEQRVAGDRLLRSLRVAHIALLVAWPRAPATAGAARLPGEGAIPGPLVTVPGQAPVFLQSLLSELLVTWGRRSSSCSVS
ncbi:hypothetical protein QOZ86_16810 [Blastococcus capsensis]|nr:hypothetical protein [Blastococcus capsensis]MDK3258167.1 hypothetical protein [Blastococcus capsensis]